MLPKTKYRKQIESERVNKLERDIKLYTNVKAFKENDKIDVFINGMNPSRYFEYTVNPVFLLTEQTDDFMPAVVLVIRDNNGSFSSVRADDYIYNSIHRRLDIYMDETEL